MSEKFDTGNWTCTIYETALPFNRHNVPQYDRCYVHIGVIANFRITRTSKLTGNTYDDPICDQCKQTWIDAKMKYQSKGSN